MKSQKVQIAQLTACLPNPEPHAQELITKLTGVHELNRMAGTGGAPVPMSVEIEKVVVVEEGYGAVQYAIAQGLIKRQVNGGYAAFFDLGRGTVIYWLVDLETLTILPGSRRVQETGGLQKLLLSLQDEPEVKAHVGSRGDASIDLLHKSIVNRTYIYGTTGYNFQDAYRHYAHQWVDGIYKTARSEWSSASAGWVYEITQLIFVGGAAPVVAPWVEAMELEKPGWKNRVKIPSHVDPKVPGHQFANVLGMIPKPAIGFNFAVDPGNGWLKYASSAGLLGCFASSRVPTFSAPKAHQLNDTSVFVEYTSGPAGAFKVLLGSAAAKDRNGTATVNDAKEKIAHQLILAAIQPKGV